MPRETLIDIIPLKPNGEQGLKLVIAKANYDTWLREKGPDLIAAGYLRISIQPHLSPDERTIAIMGGGTKKQQAAKKGPAKVEPKPKKRR